MRIDYPTERELPALLSLWQQVFGDTEGYIATFFRLARPKERCFCVTDGGSPIAALYWLDMWCRGKRLAYLYAIATAPEHRGKGICRELMTHTLAALAGLGYAGALLVPENQGLRQMYGRMGFKDAAGMKEFTAKADGAPIDLQRITTDAYLGLRSQAAGEDSVIPGEEVLALLSEYAEFYRGENILFTAARNQDVLCVMELLGSPEAAPAILRTLGCSRGIFRCPGNREPFAMYHSLDRNAQNPGWFSTALDEMLP